MSDQTPQQPPNNPPAGAAVNPKKYIRTYASDMANLSGVPAKQAAKMMKTARPAPAPKRPTIQTTSSISSAPRGTPAAISAAEPAVTETRDSVLARLREKSGQGKVIRPSPELPTMQPIMPTPSVRPTDTPLPGADVDVGSLPTMQRIAPTPSVSGQGGPVPMFHEPEARATPSIPSVTRNVQPPSARKEKPDRLHTYTSDFADRVDTKKASVFSVLAAQTDTRTPALQSVAPHKSALPVIAAGVALIIFGGAGIYLAYRIVYHAPIIPQLSVPALIVADKRAEIQGTGGTLMQSLAEKASEPLDSGTVLVTYITTSTTTKSGPLKEVLPGGSLISALMLPAPDILLRNIDPTSTVGIVHAGSETRAFFILRVTSYERTFAGMLAWEPAIANDLVLLYPPYPAPPAPAIATSTPAKSAKKSVASSTPPAAPFVPHFTDEVVANHDVRILQDAAGNSILLYGYRDKETLIIARDPAAFTELLDRLNATNTQ